MTLAPIRAGVDLARQILAAIGDDPPPARQGEFDPLHELAAWVGLEPDLRWVEVKIVVDRQSSDTIYTVEAHVLEPCEARGPGHRVERVLRGCGRSLRSAAQRALDVVRERLGGAP